MGCFRLLLALLVSCSHIPGLNFPYHGGIFQYNFGVIAVIGFYFLSGYLMTWSFSSFQVKSPAPAKSFFVDRIIRVYPLFLIVFVSTIILLLITGKKDVFNFSTLLELFIIPHNYSAFLKSTNVIPPAWSLGAEMQFYLMVPVLFLVPRRWKIIGLIVLLVYQFFTFGLGMGLAEAGKYFAHFGLPALTDGIDKLCSITVGFCQRPLSDMLGYRWPPAPFLYFLAGNLCYEMKDKIRLPLLIVVGGNILMLALSKWLGWVNHPVVMEIMLGALLFIVPAAYLATNTKMLKDNKFDKFMGRLAYPLFLVHYLAIQLMNETSLKEHTFIITLALSFVLAYALSEIQKKIDNFRYHFRGFNRTTDGAAQP